MCQRLAANPIFVHLGNASVDVDNRDERTRQKDSPERHSLLLLDEAELDVEREELVGRQQRVRKAEHAHEIEVVEVERHVLQKEKREANRKANRRNVVQQTRADSSKKKQREARVR